MENLCAESIAGFSIVDTVANAVGVLMSFAKIIRRLRLYGCCATYLKTRRLGKRLRANERQHFVH